MVYKLPSSFSGGITGAVESLKKGTLPQSIMSPVVNPAQVKQTTKLPVKKTGYVPLTREQFMKAQESGITPDQIIEFEKRRKSEMEAPQAPKFDRSNPQQFVADYEQSVREGNPRALSTGILSGITKGIGNIAQFVEKTPTAGEMIFGKKETGLPSIADPIQKRTNMVADTATSKLGVNPESNFYKGGEFAGKIALTNALLPGIGGGAGLGSRVLAGATEGALQGGAFDVVNQGKVTKENVGIGAAFGGALPVVGATLSKGKEYFTSKLPAKLQLQGLMNPAKVTMLKKQLQTDGVATPEDVAKWMIDRNIKGDKETIIKTLINRAEQSKQAVDDSLAAVSGTVQSNIAKNALQQSYDDVSKVAGLEDEASRILALLNKDSYTLSELNQVKRILDDQYNLYTKTGDPTAGLKAKGLQGIRQQLRQTIEDVAEKAGIKNIKALNNETQIARGMADAIARKDSADAVREALTAFAPTGVGGIIGGVAGPFDNNTVEGKVGNILLGMFAGRVLGSTKLKTNVASLLSKLSKKEIGALDDYIRNGGKSALPVQIIEKIDDTIKLLPPASSLPTSAKVVDVQPMTGFLPGVLQKQSEAISSKVGTQPLTTGLPKNLSKSAINSEASTVLPKKTTKVNIPGNKVNEPIIQKLPKKQETPKTPQVETKPTQSVLGGIEGVKPANQVKFNQGDSYEPVRIILNDKDVRIVRYGALRGKGLKKGFTTRDTQEMQSILDELKITRDEAIKRSDEIKAKAREVRSAKEEVILDLTKETAPTPQVEGKTVEPKITDVYEKSGMTPEMASIARNLDESFGLDISKSDYVDEYVSQKLGKKFSYTSAMEGRYTPQIETAIKEARDIYSKFRAKKSNLPLSSKSEVKYSEADEIGNYRDIPKGADNVPDYAQGLRAGGKEYTIDGEKVYMNGGFENGGRDYIVQSFGVENKGKGVGTNAIKSILDKVFQNEGSTGYTRDFTVYAITPGAKGFWKKIADKFGGEMDDSTIPVLKISRDNYLKSNK